MFSLLLHRDLSGGKGGEGRGGEERGREGGMGREGRMGRRGKGRGGKGGEGGEGSMVLLLSCSKILHLQLLVGGLLIQQLLYFSTWWRQGTQPCVVSL